MKKFYAITLCLLMVMSMFTVCMQNAQQPIAAQSALSANVAAGVEGAEPLYYYSFDNADGLTAVDQVAKAADSPNTGATYDIAPTGGEVLFANGPVGNCLYLNGKYGVKLDMEAINSDEYTISFWLNAATLHTYGPTLQLGRNIGLADTGDKAVAWLNFTQSTWGDGGARIFPVVWNRNSSTGVFPWVYAADNAVHGEREWVMITLVSSGEKYTFADDGLDRIGCKLYLNGQLVFDASAANGFYGGLSPEVLTGDGFEAYLGVNYWDKKFTGFIDELYVYGTALNDDQIAQLYAQGDPNVVSVSPDGIYESVAGAATAPAPVKKPVIITPNNAAIDTLGGVDRDLGWWSDWTDSYELVDGATVTVKMNNYSNGASNWNNYILGFINGATVGGTAPGEQFDGYLEYGMLRADAYGWGDGAYSATHAVSWSNWNEWLALMEDADVTLEITRDGGLITVVSTYVGADGTTMTQTQKFTSTLTEDGVCEFFITAEKAYVEILSVDTVVTEKDDEDEDTTPKKKFTVNLIGSDNVVGNKDTLALGWWADFTDSYALVDGSTVTVNMKNMSNGGGNWNNYLLGFINGETGGSAAPNTQYDGYKEYAILRADAYGWGDGAGFGHTVSWDDWAAWLELMKDADVTLDITRNGGTITVDATFTGADGTVMTETSTISTTMTSEDVCEFFVSGEGCYVEIESVETVVVTDETDTDKVWDMVDDANLAPLDTLGTEGSTDLGWWVDFTEGYELANGSTIVVQMNNYSSGNALYHNYVGLYRDSANYEYAVVRADAYGWGAGYTNGSYDCSWWADADGWDKWSALMTDAAVTYKVTREDGLLYLDTTFVGADGTTMTEKATITTTMTSDSECFLSFTGEGCYVEVISVVTEETVAAEEAAPAVVSGSDVVVSSSDAVVSEADVAVAAEVAEVAETADDGVEIVPVEEPIA